MINAHELYAMLYDELGDELMYEQRMDLADALLKKYVLFERPEVKVERKGKHIGFGDYLLADTSLRYWQEHMTGADREIQQAVKEYVVGHAVIDFYEAEQVDTKAERREEISKEMGHPVYMYAPQTVKTLIARLVDEEFKNGRD